MTDAAEIAVAIACCAWLMEQEEPDLALRMRDHFMADYNVPYARWNALVDDAVEYARRLDPSQTKWVLFDAVRFP